MTSATNNPVRPWETTNHISPVSATGTLLEPNEEPMTPTNLRTLLNISEVEIKALRLDIERLELQLKEKTIVTDYLVATLQRWAEDVTKQLDSLRLKVLRDDDEEEEQQQ